MDWIEIVGHLGALLSSITFIPQVYKVYKSKSVGDLSLYMMLIVFSSTLVWLVYGIALTLWPVILANGFICFLSTLLIYFKFAFAKRTIPVVPVDENLN
ncbi:SemiSWEET family sugar transporter [Fulvivirga imtechensis]|nr:SemiSWEET family transporter [Fulvivirga imtechensis]